MAIFAGFFLLQADSLPADSAAVAQVSYDTGAIVLVAGVLAVLAFLFFLQTHYANRIEQSSYVGEQIRRVLHADERERILSTIDEAWEEGRYHRDVVNDPEWRSQHPLPEPDDDIQDSFQVQEARRQVVERGRIGSLPPGREDRKGVREYVNELRSWSEETVHEEARRRRGEDRQRSEGEAKNESSRALGSLDLAALRGKGPEFVLQFTAVVTIIFAVIALGILQQLSPEQAGTILAAVAGYVLGQATSQRQTPENKPAPAPSPDRNSAPSGATPPLEE